ncbi:glycosyltransferase, partial [Sphingomonas sp. CCH9-F2]
PPAALAQRVAAAGAELVADPRDAAPLFARARVMMNPILHGSGVNIKTVDMLATGRTVVTTTKGARGLPAEVVAELRTDDTPEGFADLIVAAVR